ncbi:hypothetical protein [Mesorhizobium sp. M0674]|uniref:maleate cis-trans isomerase family protein n=1 Tax=unclassified Mesorhizobium TaxID=325217 RepID=UPI00333DC525
MEMHPQKSFSSVRVQQPSFDTSWEDLTAIGLLNLSPDVVTERELRRMVPDSDVHFVSTRMKHHSPTTIENLHAHVHEIAKAGELFDSNTKVNVFIYSCTSGSAVISHERLENELRQTAPGASLTTPMTGALRAFGELGVKNVAMVSPYHDDVGEIMVSCLGKSGVSVCSSSSFYFDMDYDVNSVSPQCLFEAACSTDRIDADAVFIPCTSFRTSSIIDRLEAQLGKPVVTAHQAMLWDALRLARYQKPISGYGKLLAATR